MCFLSEKCVFTHSKSYFTSVRWPRRSLWPFILVRSPFLNFLKILYFHLELNDLYYFKERISFLFDMFVYFFVDMAFWNHPEPVDTYWYTYVLSLDLDMNLFSRLNQTKLHSWKLFTTSKFSFFEMSSRNRHGNNNSFARLFWQQLMRIFRSPNKICPIWAKDINPACYARYSSICLMFLIIFFSLLLFHTGRTQINFYSRFEINLISSGVTLCISNKRGSFDKWGVRKSFLPSSTSGREDC